MTRPPTSRSGRPQPSSGAPIGGHGDDEYPADPYPGVAPGFSFSHLDAASHPLRPDPGARGGWRLDDGGGGVEIDTWLAGRGAAPMAARVPVLAFGSNRCPSKITWLRGRLGLEGPVVVLRAEVRGVAAVWAAGLRARDGARPATLAVDPLAVATHAVWMATPAQVAVLDACEGRGTRYDLATLHAGRVRTEDGAVLDGALAYWPAGPVRAPLLVDGAPVPCADLAQDRARGLVGVAGPVPADAATPVRGAPDPTSWPRRVFVYGTLRPGRSAWWRLAPHADPAVAPVTAHSHGRIHDTGRGYPAMTPGRATVEGTVVTLADPVAAMPALDAYEGPEYRRARAVAYPVDAARSSDDGEGDGTPCWLWMWDRPLDARWRELGGSWR